MKNELTLNVSYEEKFLLLAIRSKLEDYRIAYFLNKSRFFLFERLKKDLYYLIKDKKIYFSTFESKNNELQQESYLIKNQALYSDEINSKESLFGNSLITSRLFLMPELKEFDYFIKLIGVWKKREVINLRKYLQGINFIESEIQVKLNKLKSINNLVI